MTRFFDAYDVLRPAPTRRRDQAVVANDQVYVTGLVPHAPNTLRGANYVITAATRFYEI